MAPPRGHSKLAAMPAAAPIARRADAAPLLAPAARPAASARFAPSSAEGASVPREAPLPKVTTPARAFRIPGMRFRGSHASLSSFPAAAALLMSLSGGENAKRRGYSPPPPRLRKDTTNPAITGATTPGGTLVPMPLPSASEIAPHSTSRNTSSPSLNTNTPGATSEPMSAARGRRRSSSVGNAPVNAAPLASGTASHSPSSPFPPPVSGVSPSMHRTSNSSPSPSPSPLPSPSPWRSTTLSWPALLDSSGPGDACLLTAALNRLGFAALAGARRKTIVEGGGENLGLCRAARPTGRVGTAGAVR
mmetsp:Transcript_24487/g.77411  ORF Transcript_24487/g.77411 Transcript_24487/m.77411 type:complete len:305 (-) Transcript_24487:155-1069(-)